MNNDNKQNVGDTLKEMKDDPKKALEEDFEQTKADMSNIKDKILDDEDLGKE